VPVAVEVEAGESARCRRTTGRRRRRRTGSFG